MKLETSRHLLLRSFMTLAVAGAAVGQGPESSVTCTEGVEPLLMSYGQHTVSCQIDTPTDIDQFQFVAATGDSFRISVLGGGCLDPVIELRAPSSAIVPLSASSCATGFCTNCSFTGTNTALPESGIYGLIVFDAGNDEAGTYVFQIERIPPPTAPPALSYGPTVSDAIDPITDVDFYTFTGQAGALIRILGTAAGCLDLRMEIIDPNGASFTPASGTTDCNTGFCTGCSASADFNVTVSGEYLLFVYDAGGDETGNYTFSVNCLFGSCPNPPGYCYGDATCPCANPGAANHGCANSIFAAGALLQSAGNASVAADTVVLTTSSMSGTASLYFQGTGTADMPFDDGKLCLSGTLLRVGLKINAQGMSSNPSGVDFPISVKGALPPTGGTRYYQTVYRNSDPGFCTPSTTNRSNGLTIHWQP
ncbi:MAG: hypothetical protein ACKVWV_18615 [Planctomycetota bacterium]